MKVLYTTIRTNREYELKMQGPHLYAGIYALELTLKDMIANLAADLEFDVKNTDYHPNQLDFDHQELVAYSLLYLTQHNCTVESVKLNK